MANRLPLETVIARIQNFNVELNPDLGDASFIYSDTLRACSEYIAKTSGFASEGEMVQAIVETFER
jgi:hypothetical protein